MSRIGRWSIISGGEGGASQWHDAGCVGLRHNCGHKFGLANSPVAVVNNEVHNRLMHSKLLTFTFLLPVVVLEAHAQAEGTSPTEDEISAATAEVVTAFRAAAEGQLPQDDGTRAALNPVTYQCSRHSKSVDYNPNTIGSIELKLIADYQVGKPTVWRVQKPGGQPVPTIDFQADTGSIGGSHGILWRREDGQRSGARLSFSDVVYDYGPQTIWAEVTDFYGGPRKYKTRMLTCGKAPD